MMIKNAKQKLLALATALTLTLTMAGCTAQSTQETESAEPQQTQEVQQTENAAGGSENVEIPDAAEEVAAFDPEYSDRDKSGAWDESEAVSIALSDGGSTISGEGAEVSGNVVTVTQAGVYVLSGLLSNGRIVVEAGDEDKVQVVLSGVSITSSDGPAIWVKSADKVFLTLSEGTENALADGETYAAEDDANACVWAECDLTINGSGKLKVQGNDKRGISSKDELIITGGDIAVNAVDDGLRGKDGVGIYGGTIDITAGGDGIKADKEDNEGKGWISIDGGEVTVNAEQDGLQAESALQVTDGTLNVTAGGGSVNAEAHGRGDWGGFSGGVGGGGRKTPPDGNGAQSDSGANASADSAASGSKSEKPPRSEQPAQNSENTANDNAGMTAEAAASETTTDTTDSVSTKGLKSGGTLLISGGAVTVDSADDSIHAGSKITLSGGTLTLASGDDGVHSDDALVISGGCIEITACYEGLEGSTIDLTGGDVRLTASDDGLNATDASNDDNSDGGFRPNDFEAVEGVYIAVRGGTLWVDASGDGLDSNGGLYVTGGTVTVCGPTSGGDGALDYSGDGVITGGTVVALGSQSMAQNFNANSTQASVQVNFDNAIAAGAVVTVQDEDGNEILRVTGTKQAQCMVISSPDLAVGKTYTILADGEQVTTFEAAMSTKTGSGFGGFGGFGGGMQKPDGQPGSDGTEPPELPDGAEMPELLDGQQPPEKPDGQSGGAPQESESTDQM